MVDIFPWLQTIYLSHHFINGAESKVGHDLAELLYQEMKEVDNMISISGKAFAQFGILCSHAHRAGIQMAFAHQYASFHYQRGSGHAPFFCTQQCRYSDVTAGFHLSIGLQHYATA